jgi:enoyl-CoA hydratase
LKRRVDSGKPSGVAVVVDVAPPLVTLTLDRPKANAFDQDQLDALEAAVEQAASAPDVRVVILKGAGDVAFSSGADLGALGPLAEPAGLGRWTAQARRVLDRIAELPRPVIAALRRPAVGGGFELALACHFRVMGRSAHVALPEVRRGYLPSWGGLERLAPLVGLGSALELLATGRRVEADEALSRGIVQRVAVDADDAAVDLGRELAELPPLALAAAIGQVSGISRAESRADVRARELADLERLVRTEDTVEGVLAFFEKRAPRFKGC